MRIALSQLPTAARALGLELRIMEVRAASELDAAFTKAARDGIQALYMASGPLFDTHRSRIVANAASVRLPAISVWRQFAEAGGLISYGPNLPDVYRSSARTVVKILRGHSPANLPIELPTRFELVVNLKTARMLGLTISDSLLALADEVIE
jgi:putative ABC transport system substrate-binding protein